MKLDSQGSALSIEAHGGLSESSNLQIAETEN